MKPSHYNFIVNDGDSTIFFNALTEAFFCVNNDNVESYDAIINNPDDYYSDFESFVVRMKDYGFVVDDDEDELELVKQKYNAMRKPNHYHLMILPTYQCNLRCWYCIQDHQDMWMSDEVAERVRLLIDKKVNDEQIHSMHISWFGGEPLMSYQRVLDLTQYARDACAKAGKHFSCGITTNSTLLTPERIEALREAGVTHYQITIDGKREVHNRVKQLGKLSAFDVAIRNINHIARHTSVSLRFNYTAETLEPDEILRELKETIDPEAINNISFNLYKVWQEDEKAIDSNKLSALFNGGKEIGLRVELPHSKLCYVDNHNFESVFPNGKVGKCDNLNAEDVYGTRNEDGLKYELPVLFKGEVECECETCRNLPLCWGPCSVKREKMLHETGKIICEYPNRDKAIDSQIRNYVRTKLQKAI